MPLNLGPAPERNRTPAILISILVLAAIAAAIYFFSPRKPAEIRVTKVDIFAPHTETKAEKGSLHVLGTPAFVEDNLYVIVHVSVTNKLRMPLFLSTPAATLTLPAGTAAATVVSPADAVRLEQTFPDIAPLAVHAIGSETEVAPRATLDGSIILLFPTLKQSDWQTKKSANLTLNFMRLGSQTIDLP